MCPQDFELGPHPRRGDIEGLHEVVNDRVLLEGLGLLVEVLDEELASFPQSPLIRLVHS